LALLSITAMRTRRDWKSASPLSTDPANQPGCSSTVSAQSPSSVAPYPSRLISLSMSARKNWTVPNLVKYDDFWKFDKLITDRHMNPTRVLVDQCYASFASADFLKVLAKHGAPMKPTKQIELEPLSHYVIAYFLTFKTINYKDKKKFLEVIQYLKDEGHPMESALESLTIVNAPSDHEVYSLLTPPPSRDPSRDPSPSLSHSTTTSSVSTPPPLEDAAAAAGENVQQEQKDDMLVSINKRKIQRTPKSSIAKRERLSL
ncbi:hypothetical protein PENTCL1PPCAC_28081, partial [Pristionchus entomophagus]